MKMGSLRNWTTVMLTVGWMIYSRSRFSISPSRAWTVMPSALTRPAIGKLI